MALLRFMRAASGVLPALLLGSCADAGLTRQQLLGLFGTDHVLASAPPDATLVRAGRALYAAAQLSRDGRVACATCHDLESFGQDGRAKSEAVDGVEPARHTPTTVNAFRQIAQGWDGAVPDVEVRARRCLVEMQGLAADEAVVAAARDVDGAADRIASADDVARALGAFLRTLRTTGRWERFLDGDEAALTADERAGLATFVRTGCAICHQGRSVGGVTFHRMGLVVPYPTTDPGRQAVTGLERDRAVFKAPTLVNVAVTAPYLHDGSVASLEDTVRLMGRHQLTQPLTDAEVASIVTFLRSLTGEPSWTR